MSGRPTLTALVLLVNAFVLSNIRQSQRRGGSGLMHNTLPGAEAIRRAADAARVESKHTRMALEPASFVLPATVTSQPAASVAPPRGSHIDVLVFAADVDDMADLHFDEPHFKLTVQAVPTGAQTHPAAVRALLADLRPQVILTVGPDRARFAFLDVALSAQQQATWFQVSRPQDLTGAAIESFFWQAIQASNGSGPPSQPLISIFTTAFKTGAKIAVPYASLLAQTYTNWEWVIYDDSPDGHDDTWHGLQALAGADGRVRVLRSNRNDGFIGSSKAQACAQARGELLVEVDHDDELTPDCLALLAEAHARHPDAGFIYSETVEPFENSNKTVDYGIHSAFGSSAPYKLLMNGAWMTAHTNPIPNHRSLRHIVGVPNHVRAWTRAAYQAVGGHTRGLPVADDYDLILRTLFRFPAVTIRQVTYIQYRQESGGTFTFMRNSLIQRMVAVVSRHHEPHIAKLLATSGHVDDGPEATSTYNARPLTLQSDPLPPAIVREYHHQTATAPSDRPWVTVIMSTYNDTAALGRALASLYAQDYENWEVVIVGDGCPELEVFMEASKSGVIGTGGHFVRWYNLPDHFGHGHFATRNYALNALVASDWVAHLDQDAVWKPNHLSSLVRAVTRNQDSAPPLYALASFQAGNDTILADRPQKYKVDTSSFLFHRSLALKHGSWRPRSEVGYANDWDFVSRWGEEAWAVSAQETVVLP